MPQSIREKTFDLFLQLEEKHQLIGKSCHDIPFWSLIREGVFTACYEKLTNAAAAHPDAVLSPRAILRNLLPVAWNALIHHPVFSRKRADILFILAPRKIMTERGPLSVMIDFFADELKSSFCIFEKPEHFRHIPYRIPRDVICSDYFEIKRLLFRRFSSRKAWTGECLAVLEPFLAEFERLSGCRDCRGTARAQLDSALSSWHACYEAFRRILLRKKVKCVVPSVYYEKENMIMAAAAHSLGLPVIELQHGIVNAYHPAYNRLSGASPVFPDRILTWGRWWTEAVRCPGRESLFIPCGYPYFEHMAACSRNEPDRERTIVFISQGPVGRELSEFAVRLHHLLGPDYPILFKLHPNEIRNWREHYPLLARETSIEVIDDRLYSVYRCFDRSAWQIGVSSTALIEGLCWGLTTFIVDLETCEYMRALYSRGYAVLVKDAESVADGIRAGKKPELPSSDMFWAPQAKKNIASELDKAAGKS